MKILFISANEYQVPYPVYPVGIGYLASAVKKNRPDAEIKIYDLIFHKPEELLEIIAEYNPSVIAVSMRNVDDVNIYTQNNFIIKIGSVIKKIREKTDAPIILGGAGYSIFPVEIFDKVMPDFGIYGEGEGALLALLDSLRNP